jgi:hypothetical protein
MKEPNANEREQTMGLHISNNVMPNLSKNPSKAHIGTGYGP